VWNRQPEGGLSALGVSPESFIRRARAAAQPAGLAVGDRGKQRLGVGMQRSAVDRALLGDLHHAATTHHGRDTVMPATPHSACGVMSPELRLPRNVQIDRGAINVATYQVDNIPPLPSSVRCATESGGILLAWLMSSHGSGGDRSRDGFRFVHELVHAARRDSGRGCVGMGNEFRRKLVRVALKVAPASVPYRPRGQGASTYAREQAERTKPVMGSQEPPLSVRWIPAIRWIWAPNLASAALRLPSSNLLCLCAPGLNVRRMGTDNGARSGSATGICR
jgi:hypothetical protein